MSLHTTPTSSAFEHFLSPKIETDQSNNFMTSPPPPPAAAGRSQAWSTEDGKEDIPVFFPKSLSLLFTEDNISASQSPTSLSFERIGSRSTFPTPASPAMERRILKPRPVFNRLDLSCTESKIPTNSVDDLPPLPFLFACDTSS